jgi:hypothetical protein
MEAVWTESTRNRIHTAATTFLNGQSRFDNSALGLAQRTDAQATADDLGFADLLTAVKREAFTNAQMVLVSRMYGDVFDNISRSLILRTMQAGLRINECKKEAFKYLKDPSLSIATMCKSLNAIQFNALTNLTNPAPGNGKPQQRRQIGNVNMGSAETTDETDVPQDTTTSPETPDTDQIWDKRFNDLKSSLIGAFNKKDGKAKKDGKGKKKKDGASGGPPKHKYDPDKSCTYCGRTGHDVAICKTKVREETAAASGN